MFEFWRWGFLFFGCMVGGGGGVSWECWCLVVVVFVAWVIVFVIWMVD